MIDSPATVGLNPLSYPHHTDHVGVLCALLGVPYLVTDGEFADQVRDLYPDLQVELVDWDVCTPEYLAQHYDLFLHGDLWGEKGRRVFEELERKYSKSIRAIHVPHGFSDKGFWFEKVVEEECVLVYGQAMLDLLEKRKVRHLLKNFVLCGNYRWAYFQKHRSFYRKLVQERILSQFKKKNPMYLYAPTWEDEENNSSLFQAGPVLLEHLPDSVNLMIKIHPQALESQMAEVYGFMGQYESKPNVLFLEEFPPVYPLLDVTDVYIGDASSIGYDFLVFDRPLFFVGESQGREKRPLERCGECLSREELKKVYEKPFEDKGRERRELYRRAFEEVDWQDFLKNLSR